VEETSFLSLDPEFDSLADLEPGMIVGVAAVRDEAGEAHALMVTQHDLEDIGTHLNRARGQIQVVIPERSIFVIRTLKAERLSIKVHERTRFRSPDGSVEGIRDLERGMLVQVRGLRPQSEAQGGLLALEVLAADREDIVSVRGKIQKVDPSAGSFELQESGGNHLTVFVGERTRFISPGGEIKSVHDLEMGMVAGVQGVERGDGTILALRVAAGESGELRDHVMRTAGEITRIVPGQSTFWLLTKEGQLLKLQVRERTQFRSPDGSVQDIHDLKKGMTARLLAYATEGGDLIALRVWVRTERGRRMEGREAFDVLPEGRTDLLILAPRSPAPLSGPALLYSGKKSWPPSSPRRAMHALPHGAKW
jgi:hypothetical protein